MSVHGPKQNRLLRSPRINNSLGQRNPPIHIFPAQIRFPRENALHQYIEVLAGEVNLLLLRDQRDGGSNQKGDNSHALIIGCEAQFRFPPKGRSSSTNWLGPADLNREWGI